MDATQRNTSHTSTPTPRTSAQPKLRCTSSAIRSLIAASPAPVRAFRRLAKAASGLAFALAVSCMPATATTNISSCGSITAVDSYVLNGDISTTGTACLTITNISSAGSLLIDCQNHSVTAATLPLWVFNNTPFVQWQNCTFRVSSTTGGGAVVISSNTNGTTSYQNLYYLCSPNGHHQGSITVSDSPYATFSFDGMVSTSLLFTGSTFYKSRYGHVSDTTFDLSLITEPVNAIITQDSPDGWIGGNTLKGETSLNYVDDGVWLKNNASGTLVGGNDISYVWDMGIEPYGTFNNGTITNNTISHYGYVGIGCYSQYHCSFNNNTVQYNAFSHAAGFTWAGTTTKLFYFPGDDANSGTFTGNTFNNNADTDYSTGSAPSVFGDSSGAQFTTFNSLTITANDFGHTSGAVQFQTSTGVTDGGSNLCHTSTPAAITCH